jgi:hypothetical protein
VFADDISRLSLLPVFEQPFRGSPCSGGGVSFVAVVSFGPCAAHVFGLSEHFEIFESVIPSPSIDVVNVVAVGDGSVCGDPHASV